MTLKIIFFLLIFNHVQAAQKQLYVMGVGGEADGETTTFDNDIESIGKFSTTNGWPATVTIDGGHSKTEQTIARSFAGSQLLGSFDKNNFDKMLTDIENKIRNKKISKGEQLLIMIDSHGAMATEGEASHSISLSNSSSADKDTLKGSDTVSLDRLKKIIDLSSANGIKLAIIDDSCHSGNSLHIANADTCIISTTGDKHYGFGSVDKSNLTFGGKLYKDMQKGKNLEEIYINARTGDDPDFPMISTQNGKDIQKMMYDLITPYLYYDEISTQKFVDQYFENRNLKNVNQVTCMKDQQFNQLSNILSFLGQNKSMANHLDIFNKLKEKLQEYRAFQKDYETSIAKMRSVYDEARSKLKKNYPKEEVMNDYDLDNFLITNYDFLIANKDKFNFSKERLAELVQKRKMQNDVMGVLKPEMLAAFKKRKEFVVAQVKHSDYTRSLATQISEQSKKLYKLLYESNMDKKKSNPCRDFVL